MASPEVDLSRPTPRQVTALDVDEDGWTDLVVGASTASPVIHWNADGVLGPAIPLPTELMGARPAVVDLDADGRRDLCLGGSRWSGSDLHCMAIDGQGFAEKTFDRTVPNDYLQVFDHDDDGVLGLLVSDYKSLTQLEADGMGGVIEEEIAFDEDVVFTNPVVVDLDQDGDLDIVVVDRMHDGLLWVERDNGLLLDLAPLPGGTDANGWIEAVDDVDGDGVLDVVIDNWGTLERWAGDGLGGFMKTGTLRRFDGVVADLDGSGVVDALGLADSSGSVEIMPELVGPTLPTDLPVGTPLATADFDGDGVLDVVIDAIGLTVVSDPLGAAVEQRLHVDRHNAKVAAGLLDGDAVADVVYGNPYQPGLFFVPTLPALGRGVFGAPVPLEGADAAVRRVLVVDLDRDGHLDVVHADTDDQVRWHPGGGTVPGPAQLLPGDSGGLLVAADLDGDGADELVTADLAGLLHAYDDDGLGGVDRYPTSITLPGLVDGDAGDLDGDGLEDLLLASDGAVALLHSTGTDLVPVGGGTRADVATVVVGDPDGDGDLDAVGGNVCPFEDRLTEFSECPVDKVWWAPHDDVRPGQLQSPRRVLGMDVRGPLVVTDWNGDGVDDVLAADNTGGMGILGDWRLIPVFDAGWAQIYEATPADLDGNGVDDLVVATKRGIGVIWND